MNYWLLKSEPFKYSWEQFAKDKTTFWDGVRSYPARLHLRQMKQGDICFFYHSNEGLEIVGMAKIIKEAYQDPTTDEDWSAVDIKVFKPMKKAVTLVDMKKEKKLSELKLIKIGRLSVTPVTEIEFDTILKMGETTI